MADQKSQKSIDAGEQAFEKKHYNYGKWTRKLFSEAVTVSGPGKMIFLAGIGAEDEETGEVVHKDDVVAQARFMYGKLKCVLARNGATMADVVKQVTYVTDARCRPEITQCRMKAYGDVLLPAHTFVTVSQLAFPGMQIEIDVIAVTPEQRRPTE